MDCQPHTIDMILQLVGVSLHLQAIQTRTSTLTPKHFIQIVCVPLPSPIVSVQHIQRLVSIAVSEKGHHAIL